MAKGKKLRGKKAKLAAKKAKQAQEAEEKKEEKKNNNYRSCTGHLASRPRALDVKIGGFTMTVYGRELVKDTSIEFTIGRRYGLIGVNGCGKSTLLQALANREVPIPDHIDIYYLDTEVDPSDRTALQTVVDLMEAEVSRLEMMADNLLTELGPDSEALADVYERLENMDPETFESRAGKLLDGLGFNDEMRPKATKDMSGGWRMRVALAQALFIRPTLLLLDEPTNHLDLEACVWLEEYLKTYDRCLVVVSHSQDFLNQVCTHIMHMTPLGTLQNYTGNYDQFIKTKSEQEINQMKRYKKEQDDIKHLKAFIASCGTYSNLVKQAKSKQKILDKMEQDGLTQPVVHPPQYNFRFAECDKLAPPVIACHDMSFAYSGDMKDALYKNIDLGVDCDSRIALVGPNGAGKSTLLKLLVGELMPIQGTIRRHIQTSIARYYQHSVDQLDENKTVLEFMRDKFADKNWEEQKWRGHCGKYGVSGKMQQVKIGTLSDGLKSRIVFCILATMNPNMLLLDEPTNHLDLECIDSLAGAINAFEGGLVLVSHDFRLIDQVAKELWVCDEKTITKWGGDIRSYKQHLVKGMIKRGIID